MITETIDETVLVEAIGTAEPDCDVLRLTVEAISSPYGPDCASAPPGCG